MLLANTISTNAPNLKAGVALSASAPEDESSASAHDDDLLSDEELATVLKINRRLPAYWRSRGTGPRYIRVGSRQVRYRWGDVKVYLAAQTYSSTSEETAKAA